MGLNSDDQKHLDKHLADFLDAVTPLDQQIDKLRRSSDADSQAQRSSLATQRRDLARQKAAALRQELSVDGVTRFDAHLEAMKAKIKIVPQGGAQ